MKRLISAQDVIAAAERHENLVVDGNTIVTAQARDVAKERGVLLETASAAAKSAPHAEAAPVAEHHEEAHHEEHHEEVHHEEAKAVQPALSADELERVISAAFEKGIWTKEEVEALFKPKAAIDANIVPVGVSGRHIHLSQEHLEQLFGTGYQLTPIKDLSQPGQFAAKECVTLAGPKGVIQKVRVLGPVRPKTQVEVLAGDTFKLGIPQAIRLSGHLEGTPGVTVIGPKGTVVLDEGVIVAARHIHMNPAQAAERGFHDGQVVSLKVGGERGGMLDNVIIRVTESGNLDCHIDTEEANALHIKCGSTVEVVR
ncbi:phosphate propanoyltransferase [Olsenella porci]|jgi:propanediol utilization protein|uniref:Phosphate propanoyltransferase n=1 Tax=Olsenella porci TaxID=2652279 RepID=A0A6N7XPM0_9ACTN|nr:phosphate propanoyltransferase [Olsenella porci]MCI1997024.1 phosphate propanoyltransferase [Olsenella sp.]MST71936.1 phosphate propanoyltransferase [Olsenella porci]